MPVAPTQILNARQLAGVDDLDNFCKCRMAAVVKSDADYGKRNARVKIELEVFPSCQRRGAAGIAAAVTVIVFMVAKAQIAETAIIVGMRNLGPIFGNVRFGGILWFW